jgi:putative ABC transport system permease protein
MRAPGRHGLRLLLEQPVASLVSIACLSVGIAATATSLTLTDATVLRPYGIPDAGSLVVLWESDAERPQELMEISLPTFRDWAERARSFESMAAFASSHWPGIARGGSDSFAIRPRAVSQQFFATLGRQPLVGRDFDEQDLLASTTPPVMLSHAFWVARLNAAPDAVGRTLFIDNKEYRVIGVMPRGFAFPDAPDVWLLVERALGDAFRENAMPPDQQRALGVLKSVARIREGVSRSEALSELAMIEQAIAQELRLPGKPVMPVLTPFAEVVVGRLGARVWISVVMTAAVLLFACFNVASLRGAQLRTRAGELALRLCLGASRRRLATELVVESIPLITVSIVIAVVVALGLEAWLGHVPAISASGLALSEFRPTAWTAVAIFGLLGGLSVSVVPAALALGTSEEGAATLGSRTVVRGSRATSALLMTQAAIAMCLVAMASGAFGAFARLAAADMGFATSGVTLLDVSVPEWKYSSPTERTGLDVRVLAALEALPGATQVGGVSLRPFRFGEITDGMQVRRREERSADAKDAIVASRVVVTPGYLGAMGMRLIEGRTFTEIDATSSEPIAIVSHSLARMVWGDTSPLGKQIESYTLTRGWQSRRVIGVVADVRSRLIDRVALELYYPHRPGGPPLGSFVVKHASAGAGSTATLRAALRNVDPDLTIEQVQTTGTVVDDVLAPARLLSTAMTVLGVTGVILLMLGIVGAAAAMLRAARREVAVRQAVGATPLTAARAPLRSMLVGLVAGTALGIALTPVALQAAVAVGVAEASGISGALLVAAAAVMGAATLAIAVTLGPAMKASPSELLRSE